MLPCNVALLRALCVLLFFYEQYHNQRISRGFSPNETMDCRGILLPTVCVSSWHRHENRGLRTPEEPALSDLVDVTVKAILGRAEGRVGKLNVSTPKNRKLCQPAFGA